MFRLLTRAITDALLILDADERIVCVGEGAEDVVGLPAEVLRGRSFRSIVHPDDLRALPPEIATDGGPWEVRFRAADADRWTSVAATDPSGLSGPGANGDVLEHLEGHVLLFVRDTGAERVARDRLDLYRRALDATDNLMVISDARLEDNPIVLANRHFLKVTGYTREEVVGRNCRFLQFRPDGTRDDDQPGVRALHEAIEAGEEAHVLVRNYTKSGDLFWNDLFITPILGPDGAVTHFVGVQNDVSEKVQVEAERDAGADLVEALYESAPFMMGVLERTEDGDLLVRSANTETAEAYDVTRDEMIGRTLRELGRTDADIAFWTSEVDAALESGEPRRVLEGWPVGAAADDPDARWFEAVFAPLGDNFVSFVAEDVTSGRRLEAERSELAAAVERGVDAVIITDADLTGDGPYTRYVNPAFEAMTGWTREEIMGRNPRFMQTPETDRAELDRLRRCLEAGEPYDGELLNRRKDGSLFRLSLSIAPIRNDGGEVVRFVSTQRDVTDRRRLEAQVLDATTRAQERVARDLHDGVGQVLAGASYHLHALARDLEQEGSAHAAAAARSAEIVRDAQTQSRALAHGLFPVALEGDGLAEALARLADEVSATSGAACSFVCEGAVQVAPEARAADLFRITQEAVSNAVRHGRPETVSVRLGVDPEAGRPTACLDVVDDGAGIPDEALRGRRGIGMATMEYRAGRLGGTLSVERRPEGGTRVQVRVPLEAVPDGLDLGGPS